MLWPTCGRVLDDYGLEAALSDMPTGSHSATGSGSPPRPRPSAPRAQHRDDPAADRSRGADQLVARHAQATQASISLEVQNNLLHMVVEDNGIGILSWQKVNQGGSHGLRIMRERAEAFNDYDSFHL